MVWFLWYDLKKKIQTLSFSMRVDGNVVLDTQYISRGFSWERTELMPSPLLSHRPSYNFSNRISLSTEQKQFLADYRLHHVKFFFELLAPSRALFVPMLHSGQAVISTFSIFLTLQYTAVSQQSLWIIATASLQLRTTQGNSGQLLPKTSNTVKLPIRA